MTWSMVVGTVVGVVAGHLALAILGDWQMPITAAVAAWVTSMMMARC